jgi:hypothetical protein
MISHTTARRHIACPSSPFRDSYRDGAVVCLFCPPESFPASQHSPFSSGRRVPSFYVAAEVMHRGGSLSGVHIPPDGHLFRSSLSSRRLCGPAWWQGRCFDVTPNLLPRSI